MNTAKLNMPQTLPFLPGNIYADPTITRYHKSQLLGVKDGSIQEKTTSLQENVNKEMLASMREGGATGLIGVPQRPVQENDSIPKIAPKWLKHDRQVLHFKCYFQEPVVENATENYRVRRCTLYYYLDDDTTHIIEARVENSGIPQGVFLKRHKVPKPNSSEIYTEKDLHLGMDFDVYGRVFRIVDCDDFTRQFYANEGIDVGQPECYPADPFAKTRAEMNMKQNPPDLAEHKNYIEVMLKGGRPNKNLQSFLDNDRKVLSFSIMWQDYSYDGGDKYYTLNYFLADNTVEVKEINAPNNGKTPFPKLLKKQKLAKTPVLTHCPGMSMRQEEYYMPADLHCGGQVRIFGRDCLIYNCDDYTKAWYAHHLGFTQVPIALKKAAPHLQYQAVPRHNGYGT